MVATGTGSVQFLAFSYTFVIMRFNLINISYNGSYVPLIDLSCIIDTSMCNSYIYYLTCIMCTKRLMN